jgi:hypothetical protein
MFQQDHTLKEGVKANRLRASTPQPRRHGPWCRCVQVFDEDFCKYCTAPLWNLWVFDVFCKEPKELFPPPNILTFGGVSHLVDVLFQPVM